MGDTPKLKTKKSLKLSIGNKHNKNDSPRTPIRPEMKPLICSSPELFNTSPSSNILNTIGRDSSSTSSIHSSSTPLCRRKRTCFAEESPSQDIEIGTYLSTQDASPLREVEWNWKGRHTNLRNSEQDLSSPKTTSRSKILTTSSVLTKEMKARNNLPSRSKKTGKEKFGNLFGLPLDEMSTMKGFQKFEQELLESKKKPFTTASIDGSRKTDQNAYSNDYNDVKIDETQGLDSSSKENTIINSENFFNDDFPIIESVNLPSSSVHHFQQSESNRSESKTSGIETQSAFNSNNKNNCEQVPEKPLNTSVTFLDDSDTDNLLSELSQKVEKKLQNRNRTETHSHATPSTSKTIFTNLKLEVNYSDNDSFDDIISSIDEKKLTANFSGNNKKTSDYSSTILKNQSSTSTASMISLSRHHSMPISSPKGNCITKNLAKPLTRCTSMPLDDETKSTSSSNSGSSIELFSDSNKNGKFFTKDEIERKRLEAKRRQLLSLQKYKQIQSSNASNSALNRKQIFSSIDTSKAKR